MSQHFLLSAAARSLSLAQVLRLSDDQAHARFCEIRWSDNGGNPYCPACGGMTVWPIPSRRTWQCKSCKKQFSVTSGTIFHSRKLAHRDYLAAIAIFVNAVKGVSALQLGRDLDVSYRCAFVLAHKLRESMGAEIHNPDQPEMAGVVEIDGAYFGGKIRQENRKADRKDRRLIVDRQVVAVIRERQGRTLPSWSGAKAMRSRWCAGM
jgi:transposase-like protein